ncbi:hypothetical protein [Rhizobium sp. CC-YZS058]|uniref:hypothetical protein n=1 Tax=Rhizobium sp. CC-YZS058 TaxID=3042153 RepID=UPI002B06049C|nr:hypothetical protein [Rhizobium sp. CC-YZS058]MEA3533739.1 hypothetical protein [Rhizobium sp. CC-YZS058]
MDTIEINAERLAAGARYKTALESLGLKPAGLLWAYDPADKMFLLVLITPVVDFVGPLALSEKLFTAYRATATPPEIDPFVVRLHSPKQAFAQAVEQHLQTRIRVRDLDEETGIFGPQYLAQEKGTVTFGADGLEFRPEWVYVFRHSKRDTLDLSLQWRRFSGNVDQLAA